MIQNPTVQISQLQSIQWLDGAVCDFILGEINHIWKIEISRQLPNIDKLWPLLADDEQQRANRYYQAKDKHRFTIARAALRTLLGRYLDIEPQQIVLETGHNKKPHIKQHSGIHYNVSHSGNLILIAISTQQIGVDVELPDPNINVHEVMSVSYSKPESDYVSHAHNKTQAFYRLWTRKEALLKATAKGIDDSLKFVPVLDGHHQTTYNTIGSVKNWMVQSFDIDNAHLGCIASIRPHHQFFVFVS